MPLTLRSENATTAPDGIFPMFATLVVIDGFLPWNPNPLSPLNENGPRTGVSEITATKTMKAAGNNQGGILSIRVSTHVRLESSAIISFPFCEPMN